MRCGRTRSGPGAACSRSNAADQLLLATGAGIQPVWKKENVMSNNGRHQQRRRRISRKVMFDIIVSVGRAIVSILEFWDRHWK